MLLMSIILQSVASIIKQDHEIYGWEKNQGHQVCLIKEQCEEISSIAIHNNSFY